MLVEWYKTDMNRVSQEIISQSRLVFSIESISFSIYDALTIIDQVRT